MKRDIMKNDILKINKDFLKYKVQNDVKPFSLNELKLLFFYTYLIQLKEKENKNQKNLFNDLILLFKSKEVEEILNIKYKELKITNEKLRKKLIVLNNGEKEINVGIISKHSYNRGNGVVEIKIDEDIIPFFMYIKNNYILTNIEKIGLLRSKHSVLLYLLYLDIKNQQYKKRKLSIEQVNQIFKTNKSTIQDIKQDILKPSTQELKTKLDITIHYNHYINEITIDL